MLMMMSDSCSVMNMKIQYTHPVWDHRLDWWTGGSPCSERMLLRWMISWEETTQNGSHLSVILTLVGGTLNATISAISSVMQRSTVWYSLYNYAELSRMMSLLSFIRIEKWSLFDIGKVIILSNSDALLLFSASNNINFTSFWSMYFDAQSHQQMNDNFYKISDCWSLL